MSLNVPKPQTKRPDTLSLNMTKTKQQWEAEMERLNSKYNLNCFSDSELDSESDERGTISLQAWVQDTYLKSTKMLKLSRNFCNDIIFKM